MSLRNLLLPVIFHLLLSSSSLNAQVKTELVSCPAICLSDKATFNASNQYVQIPEDYFQIIRKTFSSCQKGTVRFYMMTSGNKVDYYTYPIGQEIQKTDMASLSSKGIDKNILENQSDLRKYFQDSIILFSKISIRARIQDLNLKKDGYALYQEATGTTYPLTAVRDTIMITPKMIEGAATDKPFILLNSSKSGKNLGTFFMRPANEEERATIIEMATNMMSMQPDISDEQLVKQITTWSQLPSGSLKISDLKATLR